MLGNILNFEKKGASTITDEALEYELKMRKSVGAFPLDVYHPKIKPLIDTLVDAYDLPRSYVGTTLLTAYSTAIGTAAAVYENELMPNYLPVWSCLMGVSSAGKSLVNSFIMGPLFERQAIYDKEWEEMTKQMAPAEIMATRMPTAIIRDVHVATLMRYVFPDNPKGILKDADEILEWINGMNQLSKKGDGTDEQFYLSSWNCRKYSAIRSGKDKYSIARPFLNVTGGVQPSVAGKLFANNRDTTGFIFRLLFAPPEKHKIAMPDMSQEIDPAFMAIHKRGLLNMYLGLPVNSDDQEPWRWYITPEAKRLKKIWVNETVANINAMQDLYDIEIHSGIYGKIQEYINRFAGILAVSDAAYNMTGEDWLPMDTSFPGQITADIMKRAIKLAQYYYKSAAETHRIVSVDMTVPPKVITVALMFKMNKSLSQMAEFYFGKSADKMKMKRELSKLVKKYPRVFGAKI
jgi:hypothetical protein